MPILDFRYALLPSHKSTIPTRIKTKSSAFAFKFFSRNSTAPQANDTTTEPRRIIDTTDIIASLSDKATKYAKSAAESSSEIIGIAHDQRHFNASRPLHNAMTATVIAIITT